MSGCCAAHSDAAGLDPFFDVVGRAERLAMLLDRLDDLPLRHHEIRGNPAGLLARMLERIDTLKAGCEPPDPELVELYAAHDRILAASGSIDRGDVFLTLNRLFTEQPEMRQAVAARFPHVMVDELEDTTPAQRAILATLASEHQNHLYALEAPGTSLAAWFEATFLDADTVALEHRFRQPPLRFWRCTNERAEAQAVAREIEHLLATGASPEQICVLIDDPAVKGGPVAAAMEERGIPFHLAGPAALFQRPEVRDALAWLRVLADPADSAAAARALNRPPVELRSTDLARLTTIARRRKLDMVSACEAALDSPQIPPEARERIQAFLKLYGKRRQAMEERRADVFVRRLIERVGLRRQRLFAAEPEVAERLLGLSRLAELATAWARREPHGSTRDFARYLSAVADAGVEPAGGEEPLAPGSVLGLDRVAAKGMEFEHAFALGLESDAGAERIGRPARSGLVLSRVERGEDGESRPSPFYETALATAGGAEEPHREELFGPAEGLHATYRKLREEVLEATLEGRPGALRAAARHRDRRQPGDRPPPGVAEAGGARAAARRGADAGGDRGRQRPPAPGRHPRAAGRARRLDPRRLPARSERERDRRRQLIASRHEPSLEAFLPRRRDGGLSLSASDLDLYLTCPLKYKFARVFGIPQEPTINQRFGILVHNVLERFHQEQAEGEEEGLERLMDLYEAGWRKGGFGTSDDELQYRERGREAMRLYWEQESVAEGEPVWLEKQFDFKVGPHHVRGRVDRVDRLPGGDYELIDYKTGQRKSEADLESDLQLALYRLAAREAWDIEAGAGSYYYVLDAEKVAAPVRPDDAERVERTVLQVGEGVLGQDFEPTPSPTVCSWCDYRLICPAAES